MRVAMLFLLLPPPWQLLLTVEEESKWRPLLAGSASVGMGLLDDDLDGEMMLLLPLVMGDGNPVALGPVVKRGCRVVETEC